MLVGCIFLALALMLEPVLSAESSILITQTTKPEVALSSDLPDASEVAPVRTFVRWLDVGSEEVLRAWVGLALKEGGMNVDSLDKDWSGERCDGIHEAECARDVTLAVAKGSLSAAIVLAPADTLSTALQLEERGVLQLPSAAPPVRRACVASMGLLSPSEYIWPHSLLDLRDTNVSVQFALSPSQVDAALRLLFSSRLECTNSSCVEGELGEASCKEEPCATALVGAIREAQTIVDVAKRHGLRLRAIALGPNLQDALSALSQNPERSLLVCGWPHELQALEARHAPTLGPPPCEPPAPCPFEPRIFAKLVREDMRTHYPAAVRAFAHLRISLERASELGRLAREKGAEVVARENYTPFTPLGRVPRLALLLPASLPGLVTAAALAEGDNQARGVFLRVQAASGECSVRETQTLLLGALDERDGTLEAAIGPACAAPFRAASHLAAPLALPMMAYTTQFGGESETAWRGARGARLFAAGDGRESSAALGAWALAQGWHRAHLLASSPGPLLDFGLELISHEISSDDFNSVLKVMRAVSEQNGRILIVQAESARRLRSLLCAGKRTGLVQAAGVVWVLPRALAQDPDSEPTEWLKPQEDEPCSEEELQEVAEGHIAIAPSWLALWPLTKTTATTTLGDWEIAWRNACLRRPSVEHFHLEAACSMPGPHAALLYDLVRLWAQATPDLQANTRRNAGALIEAAVAHNFSGLTGAFEWEALGGGDYARRGGAHVLQWRSVKWISVATWQAGKLREGAAPVKWATASQPDDGTESCGLLRLAQALHVSCRAAHFALLAAGLTATTVILLGAALLCRRRLERRYQAKLAVALSRPPSTLATPSPDRWELPRERVVINRKLGEGAFGTVYGGHAALAPDRGWSAVAVKTLKAGASTEEKLDFLSEAEAMKRFRHDNVVRLLGVVTKTEPVCTVMELMLYGDLKSYLQGRRHLVRTEADGEVDPDAEAAEEVSPRRLTAMALDVARALSYLAQLRYVHCDVAARNCLVSASRRVKLGDFGMTRLVFESDYYRLNRRGLLPVRWMAPESLSSGVCSPASDIWAFGVLLYEIVTFGASPYAGLSNSQVLERVKSGRALDLPPGLKPQLEGLMKSCWQNKRAARPSAAAVAAFLAESPSLLAPSRLLPPPGLPLATPKRRLSSEASPSGGTDTTSLGESEPQQDDDLNDGTDACEGDSFLT